MFRLVGLCAGVALLSFSADLSAAQKPAAQNPAAPKPAAPTAPVSQKPTPTVPAEPPHAMTSEDVGAFFDGLIPLQMQRSDVAGASVLVMKDGKVLLKKGYGFSDIKKKTRVDPDVTIFRLASISKLFTWISVMQLAEQNKLDIDTDVNKYLDFQIAPKFGKPITLRNLMTHTGGFEEELRDIILTDPKQGVSLRDFLIANQPHRMFPPGIVPAYSNYGVGLAGYVVQRVSGEPFEQYVSEHIFDPLGMKHSSFHEPMQSDLTTFVSDGYRGDTESPAIGFEIFNPAPAGGISSTAADMGQFAQALLGGGEWNGHRILKPETLNAMWTRQFAASDQLPGICMGFYQVWRNGLHYIGHEGDLIAFHSLFFVEPKEKLVLFISYNSTNSEYTSRDELLNGFTDRYYPYTPSPDFQKFPLDRLQGIEGAYQPTRRADSTKIRLGNLLSQRQASVDKDGVLTIEDSKDLRGHERKWKSIGKDLWQAEGDQQRLFAIRDADGKVIRVAFDFAGAQAERVRWFDDARFNHPLLFSSLGILLLVVITSLIRIGRRIFFAKRPSWKAVPGTVRLTLGTRISAYVWILFTIGVSVLMGKLVDETYLPTRGMDKYFALMNWGAVIAILFSIFPVIAGVRIWQKSEMRWITRVKFSLVSLACLFLVWFSIHWNVLGPAHRF